MSESVLRDKNIETTEDRPDRGRTPMWQEFGALGLGFLALFLTIALIIGGAGEQYIGKFGTAAATGLQLLFGTIVAFGVPAFLLFMAVQMFRGIQLRWVPGRILGIFLLIPALCGLLALPYADDLAYKTELFQRAGVLGSFMVEWSGLRLVGAFGSLGAAMVLVSGGIVGLVLVTDMPVSSMAAWLARPLMRTKVGRRLSGEDIPVPPIIEPVSTRKKSAIFESE